jgi:hypothetical protein
MLRIFRAPFVPVEFADVFFADQLCSLVLFFQDFWFTSCFFAYDAWIDEPYVCTAMDPYVKPLIGIARHTTHDTHDTTRHARHTAHGTTRTTRHALTWV